MDRHVHEHNQQRDDRQSVLEDGNPCTAAQSGKDDERFGDHESDDVTGAQADRTVADGGDHNPHAGYLKLDVRQEEDRGDDREHGAEPRSAEAVRRDVGDVVQVVPVRVAPEDRADDVARCEPDSQVRQEVEDRHPVVVGPTGCSEIAEAGVRLARHQDEDEHNAEAPPADRPLSEVRAVAAPQRQQSERDRAQHEHGEDAY